MPAPTFLWPVSGYYAVSSGFLDQRPYGQHNAIDIPAPTGTPVLASARGRVAFAGGAGDCGLAVFIDHPNGWRTHYCHHNFTRVTAGQDVAQGQRIGDVGATGAASGPHLHFNLFALAPPNVGPSAYVAWVNKWAVDPLRYLVKEPPEEDEMKLYTIKGSAPAVYITDGLYKRRASSEHSAVLSSLAKVHPVENQAVITVNDLYLSWLKPFPEGAA